MNKLPILLIAAIFACIPAFIVKLWLADAPNRIYTVDALAFSQQERAFEFDVTEPGGTYEFLVHGKAPRNTWLYAEFHIFGPDGDYLFTYIDNLWSEEGIEDGEYWKESVEYARLYHRLDKSGRYKVLIDIEAGPFPNQPQVFYFSVNLVNGNPEYMAQVLTLLGGFILLCFALIAVRYFFTGPNKSPMNPTHLLIIVSVLALVIVGVAWAASRKDDTAIDWTQRASSHPKIYFTPSLNAQGETFRGGAGKGGK